MQSSRKRKASPSCIFSPTGALLLAERLYHARFRAFSLLLCTVKRREVRLFLRKSHVGSGCSVYTRSENALAET